MKLFERYKDRGYHTCITTTFGIEFDAYEQIVLPRLRAVGCYNNLVLADQTMLNHAVTRSFGLPVYAGRHYSIAGIAAKGVFHPKLTLQIGQEQGRMMIGSANISASGLAGNLEMVGQLEIPKGEGVSGNPESGEARLIAAALAYLRETMDLHDPTSQCHLQWMMAHTPWIQEITPAPGLEILADGTGAALLTSSSSTSVSIGQRYEELISERPVERLIVISPYWDHDLGAVRQLAERLDAQRVALLIDKNTGKFPAEALAQLPRAEIYDLRALPESGGAERFIHAKAFIAETPDADHLLFGSANCTRNALGVGPAGGVNHETCLYRRLPPKTLLDQLRLTTVIAPNNTVAVSDVPPFEIGDEILPAKESRPSPGTFDCQSDLLSWRLAPGIPPDAQIELFDQHGDRLTAKLIRQADGREGVQRYLISDANDRPGLARVRCSDGTISAPAVVRLMDVLHDVIRERRDKSSEKTIRRLAAATEAGLWFWEVLFELQQGIRKQVSELATGRMTQAPTADVPDDETSYEPVSYQQFIEGRQQRGTHSPLERNSLAGSDFSLARDCLNRINGKVIQPKDAPERDDASTSSSLDRGDETEDGAGAIEHGQEFEMAGEEPPADRAAEEAAKVARNRQAMADRGRVVSEVDAFIKRLRAKRGISLDSHDLFCFRAMLTILATLGQPGGKEAEITDIQVLPLSSQNDAWPTLMGKLLYLMFKARKPAVRDLTIDDHHDQLPDDIMECWVMAMWSVQACRFAADNVLGKDGSGLWNFGDLAVWVYTWTLPGLEGVPEDKLTAEYERVNQRYAVHLGLDPQAIRASHEKNFAARDNVILPAPVAMASLN